MITHQYEALTHGHGLPLVMLHGMMGQPENWQGVFPHLPPGCQAIALRIPFFKEGLELASVPDVLEYAQGFIDQQKLGRMVLCGNSLGGHASLDLALRMPDRVCGLILTGSSGLFERTFTSVGSHPGREWVAEKIRDIFFNPVHATDELIDEVYSTISVRRNTRDLVKIAKSAKRDNVAERLRQIACPVLLIWGRDDQITPPDVAEEFHNGVSGSELQWLENCGHAAMIEHPDAFGQAINRWWQKHFDPQGQPLVGGGGDVSFTGRVLSWYLRRVEARLVRASADPAAAQKRLLMRLIQRAADTDFGRRHGFALLRSHADFAKAVPVRDYVSQLDMFQRIQEGEPDVSWPGRTRFFAQTSGTTAGDKHIPVTSDMARANRLSALSLFASYRRWNRSRYDSLMDGRLLFLGGSTSMTRTPQGARIGDLSGIATGWIPWPLSRHYEPGYHLALLDNWERKVQAVAERVAHLDIRFVTGMPSWVKILFDRVCQIRRQDPVGGISLIWPNLQLFVHGGVNFQPYRSAFLRYLDPAHPIDFMEVYPASEGFVALQPWPVGTQDAPIGMEMLTDHGLFFEFVPLSQWGSPDAPRLTIDQVALNVPYSLVLSTCAGLWAYDLGDVVRFVSLVPPRIVFAGRNKHFINAYGENLIAEQIASAVADACQAFSAEVDEFTVAPLYAGVTRRVGTHQYVVEFRKPPADLAAFAAAIDRRLQALNNDYSIKRRGDLGMTVPEITPVPAGAFYRWMKLRGKLGGQHKVPLCANDRRYVDDLLKSLPG